MTPSKLGKELTGFVAFPITAQLGFYLTPISEGLLHRLGTVLFGTPVMSNFLWINDFRERYPDDSE